MTIYVDGVLYHFVDESLTSVCNFRSDDGATFACLRSEIPDYQEAPVEPVAEKPAKARRKPLQDAPDVQTTDTV